MKAINPATNELIKEYKEHTKEEASQIINACHNEHLSWRKIPFGDRAQLMHKAADNLRENKEEYARTMTLEMGKIIAEARAEIEKCAWVCDFYAGNAERFLQDEIIETDASKSFAAFEPLGVVLAVMPWNFPFWQVFRFAAPALMAGNGGVLKHASNVPGCALAIERVFHEAGFPENIFRTMLIASGKVADVIKNNRIKAVTLTGSEPAGMQVASIAGQALKKTVLELGGSDPYIVLEDADIKACVETSVTARMINAGQSCIAAKRFIVVESAARQFEEEHTRIMKSLKIGDPLSDDTQVAPMARMDLLEELDGQVQKSIKLGAKLLCGGKKAEGPGAFYLPTVLSDVKKGMPVYNEETFGPVTAIIKVKDAEDAVEVANDSEFGLGGSLWSKDLRKAESIARRIETGSVFINGMTKSDPRLPFGGIKKSGFGRELSHYGIKEFVNIKTIWIA
ncbi:MAG: NAD-dependent succinate-semialdehyde dehydrogenase [candidate division Zixibacteria bacterium]|nr:NAD-dependent succinate-semialdehyde dehydrogenase [candidate division Zixibacteria bacterium]